MAGLCSLTFVSALFLHLVASQSFNPTILQDSRDLPKVDGSFGFLYRTEDGIAHAAKGDANGVIHGRFSYTDPTGLKVNYNYNAGSRNGPQQQEAPEYQQPRQYQQPKVQYQPQREVEYQPRQENRQPQYEYEDNSQYEPEPEYVPQTRPSARAASASRPQYSARYRGSVDTYSQRRSRPYPNHNEVYDYGN